MKKEENLEKQVKELEKSNRWMKGILLSLVGIFFIGLCVGFGYMLGNSEKDEEKENIEEKEDKENKEDKEEEKDEEELQLETLTKDSPVVKELFKNFNESDWVRHEILERMDNSDKRAIAYLNLDLDGIKKVVKCSNLEDKSVYYEMGWGKAEFTCVPDYDKTADSTNAIDSKYLKDKYQEMFGVNSNYKNEDFIIISTVHHYDKKNDVFAEYEAPFGDETVNNIHTLDSIEQNGTILKLNTTLVSEYDSTDKSSIIYTFEYEKETGNYIFVSREEK